MPQVQSYGPTSLGSLYAGGSEMVASPLLTYALQQPASLAMTPFTTNNDPPVRIRLLATNANSTDITLPVGVVNYSVWLNFQIWDTDPAVAIFSTVHYQGTLLILDSNGEGGDRILFDWPSGRQFWVKSWYEIDLGDPNDATRYFPKNNRDNPAYFTDSLETLTSLPDEEIDGPDLTDTGSGSLQGS